MSIFKLTQADNGKTVEVHVKDRIAIHLEENRTTGYLWNPTETVDEEVLKDIRDDFILPEKPKFGEGGSRVLEYEAKTEGTSPIELKKWRVWEGEDSSIEHFSITVIIKN